VSDRLLSTGEAAKALGLSRRSMTRWVTDGSITPALVTPGGHLRWDVEDLRAQLARLHERSS
jgi:excisionase family DNA binding protein